MVSRKIQEARVPDDCNDHTHPHLPTFKLLLHERETSIFYIPMLLGIFIVDTVHPSQLTSGACSSATARREQWAGARESFHLALLQELSLLQHQYRFSFRIPQVSAVRAQSSYNLLRFQFEDNMMQIGTVFSGHALGGPMGRKRWGKSEMREGGEKLLVCNWLPGDEGWWGLGKSIFRGPRKGRSWCGKV